MFTKRILVVGYLFSLLLLINFHTTESISNQEEKTEATTINEQKQIQRGRGSGRRRSCDPLYRYLFETCGQWPFSTTPSPDNPFLSYHPSPLRPPRPRPSPNLPPPPLVPSPPPPPPSPLVPSPPPPPPLWLPPPSLSYETPPVFSLPPPEDDFPPLPPIIWLPPSGVTSQSLPEAFDHIPPPLM